MKYLSAFSIEIANAKEYYADWLAGLLGYPVQLAALWLIWVTLFRVSGTGMLGMYGTGEIVAYYFGVIVLRRVLESSAGVENHVWNDVIRGNLDTYLVRPISYPLFFGARVLSKAVIALMMGLPVLIVYLVVAGHVIRVHNVLAFMLMAVFGVCVYFLFWFLFGMLSFRMERIFGIRDILWTAVAFLSGSTIPLDLLPDGLQKVSMLMPLRYLYFDPVSMLLGRQGMEEMLVGFVIVGGWVVGLATLSIILWRRGLVGYESAGG